MRFNVRKPAALLVAVAVAAAVSSVGSSAASGAPHATSAASFLAPYAAKLAQYEAPVSWDGPTTPAKAPKKIFIGAVNCTYAVAGCKSGGEAFTAVAKRLGWKSTIIIVDNPTGYGQAMQTLLNEGVKAIYLGGVEEQLVPIQINEARAKGIPVVSAGSNYQLGGKGEVTTDVHSNVALEGQLMADAAIVQSKGSIDALFLQDAEFAEPVSVLLAVKAELAGCKQCHVTYASPIDFTSATINTTLPSRVVTALQADPSINSIMLGFDPPATFVVPAIDSAGDRNKVTLYTQLGNSGPLALVQAGNVIKYDVANSVAWEVWGDYDEVIRYLDKQPLVNENIPLQLFTSQYPKRITADAANDFAALFAGYEQHYTKLWGLG